MFPLQNSEHCAIMIKSSGTTDNWTVGVDDVEGPPVPMPNTEVKLNGAEDTWMVTSRKNRKMPTQTKSDHSKKSGRFFFAAASCRSRFAVCPFELCILFRNKTVRHPVGMHPTHRRRKPKGLLWANFLINSYFIPYFIPLWNFTAPTAPLIPCGKFIVSTR